MPDYDAMYHLMFNAQTDAINILQETQRKAEEMYISFKQPDIRVLEPKTKAANALIGDMENDFPINHDKEQIVTMVGSNIRKLRVKRDMSIDELAAPLEMTPGFLGLIERGRRSVTATNLYKLSEVLNVSVDDFFRPLESEPQDETKDISAT